MRGDGYEELGYEGVEERDAGGVGDARGEDYWGFVGLEVAGGFGLHFEN